MHSQKETPQKKGLSKSNIRALQEELAEFEKTYTYQKNKLEQLKSKASQINKENQYDQIPITFKKIRTTKSQSIQLREK